VKQPVTKPPSRQWITPFLRNLESSIDRLASKPKPTKQTNKQPPDSAA
jgi:hypothetical protein